ncbi:MAG: hypothetical protein ACI38Y_01875 [Candidatus Methanomethylophilaceae archaeon]
MRLPKTSRTSSELKELRIGKGDYALGGARSLPFLDLDGARRRRPLVFGEVVDDLSSYPDLAAEMFSGRQDDPAEWAIMWKEIGADGVCLRITDGDIQSGVSLVRTVCDRTRLPVVVDSSPEIAEAVASEIKDSILMLISDSVRDDGHIAVIGCRDADDASSRCGKGDAVVSFGQITDGPSLRDLVGRIEEYRSRGLSGDTTCSNPIAVDVTYAWDPLESDWDARRASMLEATEALAAMMAGADMLIMKGPGAADMARVYGEELADL